MLGLVLVLHHEPWRDEADTWLLARDASIPEIFHRANYIGSPVLWYLLQAPLAKLGAPYLSLGLLNLVFAITGVALFVNAAPLSLATRILFAFSYFAAFQLAGIARSYALSMMLFFAVLALERRRHETPWSYALLLALLFNTNAHSIALAGPLLALWAWQLFRPGASRSRRSLMAFALALAGALIAALQIVPPPDGQLQGLSRDAGLRWIPITLAGGLAPWLEHRLPAWIASALVYVAVAASLITRPRALFFLFVSSGALWSLFTLKYAGGYQHWAFLLLALLGALWLARNQEKPASTGASPAWATGARRIGIAGISAGLLWSTYVAGVHWWADYSRPFSGSRAMAEYMIERGLTGVPVAAWPAPYAEPLLPYLPMRQFYYPGIQQYGSYMKWDRRYEAGLKLPQMEVLRRVNQSFAPDRDVLLLTNEPMLDAERMGFGLIHTEIGNEMMGDEQYFLYGRRAAPPRER